MRRYRIVLALLASALSIAGWAASAGALASPRTFDLLAVTESEYPLGEFGFERPPRGGDQFAFVDGLYRWAGPKRGARVGRVEVMATFLTGFGPNFTQHATVQFVAQAYLPGGTVLAQGFSKVVPDGPSSGTLAVVGGTGVYGNARGTVRYRDLGDGTLGKTNLHFELLP